MATKSLYRLLAKNLIVECRSFVRILMEISIIVIILFLSWQIKPHMSVGKANFHRDIILNDLSLFSELMSINESAIPYKIFFTPKNNYTDNIFKITAEKLKLLDAVGFDSEDDMIENFDASSVLAGVVLRGHDVILRFPNYFRTRPNKNSYKFQDFWLTRCTALSADNDKNDIDFYIREGFLQLLYTIVRSNLEIENIQLPEEYEIPTRISSVLHDYEPKVCVNNIDGKSFDAGRFLKWSLYYFIYLVPFINLICKLSREYEENIFAHHGIYGVSYNVQTFAHLIVSLLHFLLLDTLVIAYMMLLGPALPVWKSKILLLFLILYNMLLIFYAMTLSLFIKNANVAQWCGIALWITSYAVFVETLNTMMFDIWKPKISIISLMLFNNLFPNGLMDYFEEGESKSSKEIYQLLGFQLLILFFYGCLFKSVEYVWPLRYIKTFQSTKVNQASKKNCVQLGCNLYENHIEFGPLDGEVLQLKNVSSYCDDFKKKPQLRNISMRIFINEISVILGSRNSGKTDFINTLAGWQAYKGSIAFQGQDISENWPYYRQHIDVSMTNNALFDYLTIHETLKYFILLKNTAGSAQIKSEQEKWCNVIISNLGSCRKLVKNLSFGEKRILALCCVMACNSCLILLDEPTVHMRGEEQSKYWNILKQEKQNRAIIVTTFNIDEASEIGDRIGILYDGCLTAWGTSYFLRSRFGEHFYLICFLQPMVSITPINQLLEQHITNPKIHNHFPDRVIYSIPSDKKPIFQRLLIDVEKNSTELGITNIYVTGSSLDDVYMTLTLKSPKNLQLPDIKNALKFIHETKSRLKRSSVQAVLYKRLLCQSKHFLPISIIFVSFFLMLALSQIVPSSLNVNSIMFFGTEVFTVSDRNSMEISNVDDIESGLFNYKNVLYSNEANGNRSRRNYNSLAALELEIPSMSMWFNERTFHSAPLALNLGFNDLTNASIYINKPIVLRKDYDMHIILGIVMPLTMSTAFVNLQDERFSSMLILQKLAGLNDGTKWIGTFLYDIFICFAIFILYITMIAACVLHNATWLIVMAALILFFLSGIASLLFSYLMFLFIIEDNKIRAFTKIFLLQISLGLIPYILYTNILQEKYDILFYLLMIFPGFSVLHGTTKIFDNNEKMDLYSYFLWDNPGVLDSIFFLSLTSFIYFVIFVAVTTYRRVHMKSTPKKVKGLASVCYPYDDERVVKEKVRISNMNIASCRAQAILVDQLESELPTVGNRVNSISFALNKPACLGIYGSSHSGKSHLLKQLIGEKGHWFGEVYISGYSLKKEMSKALQQVGYCPQNKGFNSLLTPTELFKFFLMMNGIRKSEHLKHIRNLSVSLHLRNHMNSRIGDLPENLRRRINVAVALIVRKKTLIFDEPTRGLPAFDRLLIWNIIKYCRSLGNTIIFTTSESLELKELADYAVTVNDGEMLSLNSPHKMEYQYKTGFYLEIKLMADGTTLEQVQENLNIDVENLHRFVMFFHERSEMLYRCGNVCKYYIPVENVIYSYIFGVMEKHRNRLNIADYTLTPFSLDRVLKLLQKSRKAKIRPERAPTSPLKDPKTLPRRD